jgi:hypothetical protein
MVKDARPGVKSKANTRFIEKTASSWHKIGLET